MDVRDISLVFVAKECNRTNGSDTIDGDSVTGVQIQTKLEDDGSAAETYYGAGEIVVTDEGGVAQAVNITKAVPYIQFHQRSADGNHHFASPLIKGTTIKSYTVVPYLATTQQTTIVHTIDDSLDAHTYMLKIRRIGSEIKELKEPTVRTVSFKSASAGSTAAQIATGLVAAINTNLANDLVVPVTAVVGGASSDAVIITASAFPWELGKFKYERLRFVVELVNFDATIVNNMYDALTYNSITYAKATIGAGNYQQVAQAEYFAKSYSGANRDLLSGVHRRNVVPMDYSTTNTYDTVVLGWENIQGDFSANVRQEGNVVLYLPVENNSTSSQQLALITLLNSYVYTSLGIGTSKSLT